MAKKQNDNKNLFKGVGKNVSLKEAQAISQKTGKSVEKIFEKAQNQGYTTKLGRYAGATGYVPQQSGVTLNNSYMQGAAQYQQQQMAAAQQAGQAQQAWSAGGGEASGQPMPEFDWAAWNQQMMAQQQAVWASMDAMNAEFLAQQEQVRGLDPQQQQQARSSASGYGSAQADAASVKRKKRTKKVNGVTTTGATNKTLSLGGSNPGASNGLSIGKQT